MKKRLNGKEKYNKRKILSIIVIIIFLLYFSLVLNVSNRRFLYIEGFFKTISSCVNSFFIDKVYSSNDYRDNIVNSKIKYLEKENNNLKRILNLKEENTNYVVGKVINHISKTWFDKIEINVGFDEKISNDLPVINHEGLIGFISKTGKKVSEVKLLTSIDDDSLISVMVETEAGGSVAGVLSGYDVNEGLFKISDVTNKTNVSKGDLVVLSGYDNGAYKGIYVGKVVKEEKEDYGLSRIIWVESSVNFDDLMFVVVPTMEVNWWL